MVQLSISGFSQKLAILFIFSLVLTGCASNKSLELVNNYAQKSKEVEETLLQVYKQTHEARVDALMVQASRDGIASNDLNIQRIDNSGQMALLKNLISFSQSIYLLSSESFDDELNENTKQLNSSIISMSKRLPSKAVDNSQIKIATTAINALVRARSERARYQYLKAIFIGSNEIIQNSFQTLSSELASWQRITKISMEKELRTRLYLLNNPNRCETIETDQCATITHSLEERIDAYRQAYILKSKITSLSDEFDSLRDALTAVQNLNSTLVESLKRDADLTKSNFVNAFESAQNQIKKLKDFQSNL